MKACLCGRPARDGFEYCDYPGCRRRPAVQEPPVSVTGDLEQGPWIVGLDDTDDHQPQPDRTPTPPAPPPTAGSKLCRRCGQEKPLGFFPRDRSRRDGRWHTCTLCRKDIWRVQEKPRLVAHRLALRTERAKRNGLKGLKHMRRSRRGEGMYSLSPDLKRKAESTLNRSVERDRREGRHPSQPCIALRIAAAISSAPRVGDRRWARKMHRLKGCRRAERRKAEQEAALAELREARKATKAPQVNWQLRP